MNTPNGDGSGRYKVGTIAVTEGEFPLRSGWNKARLDGDAVEGYVGLGVVASYRQQGRWWSAAVGDEVRLGSTPHEVYLRSPF